MRKRLIVMTAVLLSCFAISAFAQDEYIKQGYQNQSRLSRKWHRIQIGASSIGASGYYKGEFDEVYLGELRSRYHEGHTVSKGGLGVTLGTFYRLAKLGKKTAIAFDVDVMYNFIYWKGLGNEFYTDKAFLNTATTRQLAVPLGLELKFGSDARLEKNHRFCMSFGGGVMPCYNRTALIDTGKYQAWDRNFGYMPFTKFEIGMFTGICWKVRVMYSFGEQTLLTGASNWHKNLPYGLFDFSLQQRTALTVSLLLMPFSFDWPDNGWWNNSRTSGKMYKGWQPRNKRY
jgi:hypothetical protein